MKIALDAGHGVRDGHPTGARGHGLIEDEVVWDWRDGKSGLVQRCGHLLRLPSLKHRTIYTREGMDWIALFERVRIAHEGKADAFLSFHCNASIWPLAHGIQLYIAPGDPASLRLAKALRAELLIHDAGGLPIDKSCVIKLDRESQHTSLYVLRKNRGIVPAVLIEAGFLTNQADADCLKDRLWRQGFALRVVKGVERFRTDS